ncbi:MAG: GLPGLI family protein, partial [Bacteroidota bacterium]
TVGASLHKSSCVLVYHIKLPDKYNTNFLKLNPHTMKILFLSVFTLFISVISLAQGNSIEVIYAKAYKNLKDTSDIPPRSLKNLKYSLQCSPTASRFEQLHSTMTSGDKTMRYKAYEFSRFLYRDSGYGIHYKNTAEKQKLLQTRFNDSTFLVKENYNQYKWVFKNEKKWVLGVECHKAVGSYQEYSTIFKKDITVSVTVWYAPSVPFPFGPSGYDGLPGLVLASERDTFYFIATSIRFCSKAAKITPPDTGKRLSRKEFNKMIYEMYRKHTRKQ